MAKLYYQGHASIRITTNSGVVIYYDPYAGDGYELPADLILVTHQHQDHNKIELPARAADCVVYQNTDALKNGIYQKTTIHGVEIEATEAYNKNHPRESCVGYLLRVDGVLLYLAGDTSMTDQMRSGDLAARHIDYAFLPIDGQYNMDVNEAIACADLIKARHTVPMHMTFDGIFNRKIAEKLKVPGQLIIAAGEEIDLSAPSTCA